MTTGESDCCLRVLDHWFCTTWVMEDHGKFFLFFLFFHFFCCFIFSFLYGGTVTAIIRRQMSKMGKPHHLTILWPEKICALFDGNEIP